MGKIIVGLFIFGAIIVVAYDTGYLVDSDFVKALDYTKDLITKIKER